MRTTISTRDAASFQPTSDTTFEYNSSDNEAWVETTPSGRVGLWPELENGHFKVGPFTYANFQGPSEFLPPQRDTLRNHMLKLCDQEESENFACTRVDIVAHSMGGLLARKFIRDNTHYKRIEDYNQGSVRRLITLGTPHFGSGLGSLFLISNLDIGNCITDVGAVKRIITIMEASGRRITNTSAMYDIALNSNLLTLLNLNEQQVNTHGIIGNTGAQITGPAIISSVLFGLTGCSHADLFQGNDSDQVVSVISAQGNLPIFNATILQNARHTAMGLNRDVIISTLSLLNSDLAQFSMTASKKLDSMFDIALLNQRGLGKPQFLGLISTIGQNIKAFQNSLGNLFSISQAVAQQMPTVSLAADTLNPMPGSSVTFVASATGENVISGSLTDGADINFHATEPPFQWTIDIPENASGVNTLKAIALIDDTVVTSNPVTINVVPDLTKLQQLRFLKGASPLLVPGSKEQQYVIGSFTDGLDRGLTQGSMGTIYSENIVDGSSVIPGDSPVLDIDANGLLHTKMPGVAEIVATNSGIVTINPAIKYVTREAHGIRVLEQKMHAKLLPV